MQEVILALIGQLNSSVFLLFLILIIVCIAVYRLGFWTHKFESHDQKVEKLESLAERVVSLMTKVDMIYQIVNPNSPTKAASPVSLTDVGKKMVDQVNANVVLQKYLEKLEAEVEKLSPKNAYDVQTSAFDVARGLLLRMLDEDELQRVKKTAFEYGILVEDVMMIFGVLLRNEVLKNKEMSISEVDDHAPLEAK